MFDVRISYVGEPSRFDQLSDANESRPHVDWQRRQLGIDSLIQRLDCPCPSTSLYQIWYRGIRGHESPFAPLQLIADPPCEHGVTRNIPLC
jgi:hypothetical protein